MMVHLLQILTVLLSENNELKIFFQPFHVTYIIYIIMCILHNIYTSHYTHIHIYNMKNLN